MSSLKQNIQDVAAPVLQSLKPSKKSLGVADEELRAFVRTYPIAAAAGALALGLMLGRALARR